MSRLGKRPVWPARPSSRWATVWVLAAGGFTVNLDARAIVPLLPSLAEDIGVSVAAAGVVVTAYMVPYGVLQLVYGPLADRFGRLGLARLTLLAFAVSAAACGAATSLEALTIVRFLAGASAAAVIPMGLAYVGDAFPYRDRPAAISVLMTSAATAQLISLAVSGLLAGFVSWRAMFFLSGALAGAVLVALIWVRAERSAETDRVGALAGFRAVMTAPGAAVVMLLACVEGMLQLGGTSFLGGYLRETWGLPYPTIGAVLACYAAMTLLASRSLAWAARRFSENQRLLAGLLVSALGYASMASLGPWPVAAPIAAVLGLGFVAAHTVLQTRATELAPRARGTSVAVFACSLFVGGAVGTMLAGGVIERWGYRSFLLVNAAGFVALAVAAWSALGRSRGRR